MASYISYLLCIVTVLYFLAAISHMLWLIFQWCFDPQPADIKPDEWFWSIFPQPQVSFIVCISRADVNVNVNDVIHLWYELLKLMLLVTEWLLLIFIIYTLLLLFVRLWRKYRSLTLRGPQCCCWGSTGEVSNEGLKWGESDVCGEDECECGWSTKEHLAV